MGCSYLYALTELEVPEPPVITTFSLLGIMITILVILGLASIKFRVLRKPFAIVTVVTWICFGFGLLISMGFAETLGFLGLIVSGIAIIITKIMQTML
ncbi:hypothetical protein DRP04_01810 [Archaeoglobales archaeon]|nr:MAG: hypothetical protein DRP04_01810 [Archaeoglobales archaeon]